LSLSSGDPAGVLVMADQILTRFINQENDAVEWLPINDSIPSEPVQGTLKDLAIFAKNKQVILLLPASDVLFLGVNLPIKSASQINKALPFALEDLLADEIETYHLVWYRQPKDMLYVAVISHDKFQAYLLGFQELGIELTGVYSETLCLPFDDQTCSILIDQQNAILRTGQWLGGGIDVEVLSVWIDKLIAENPELQSLQIWQTSKTKPLLNELTINKTHHEIDSPLLLFQMAAAKLGEGFNLLSGSYGRKTTTDLQWKKWLPALVIFGLAAFIQTGIMLKSYWSQKTELAALETQTLALFKQSFPDVKRIVNIKVQAEQQLADLKKQQPGNGSRFIRLLYGTGQILSANSAFQLQQLDFTNDILQLQLTAPEMTQLEQFKQQLENSNELSVKILSAESAQNALEAHLEIREK
jgi:general secretion pathway protein L